MTNLEGKVAIVAGASAEGGTGWAIAEALAHSGAKVVVGARTFEPLKRLADKIGGIAIKCDVAKEDDVQALTQAALDNYGKLDIAVNSAGLPVLGLIADIEPAALQRALDVNYLGQFYFVKHAAEAIGNDGSIIFISSMSTTHPTFPHFSYACAKSASDCLTRYAALEYGSRNIRVNSILPGAIMSEMAREAFSDPAMKAAYVKEIPLGRPGYPEDFANAVLWLAGPSYVTGLALQVNGGNQLTRFPYLDELPRGSDSFGESKPLHDRVSG